jgi:hypothetical protein
VKTDAINISNILNRKEVVKEIPPYFKNQYVPIVYYSYTNSIGRKIFNYITSEYMSRWVVLKRRVGAVTNQRILKVLFYVNILKCFFVELLGIHHIRTILFSLPVNYLKDLRDFGLGKGGVNPFSPKYRLSSIICDVFLKYGGISFTTSFLLSMLLMLIASVPLLASGIWRNLLLLL